MMLTIVISGLGFVIARRLREGYIDALEASLIHRADVLEISAEQASPLRSTMMESFAGIDLSMSIDSSALRELRTVALRAASVRAASEKRNVASAPAHAAAAGLPSEIASMSALRSGEVARVREELRRAEPLSPLLVPQVISLLAWDEVNGLASHALCKAASRITGPLIDHMLDPDEDFAIRRRLPRVLGTCATQRAHDGLMAALSDGRFEVRYQAAIALARMQEQAPGLSVDRYRLFAAVLSETNVSQSLWDDPVLIDLPGKDSPAAEAMGGPARGSRRLEHVFTILSLVLPRSPLWVAYKSLLTDDAVLRGTGLEYLESVLPRNIWDGLQPFLGDPGKKPRETRSRQDVLEDLMLSRESIDRNLEGLGNKIRGKR